MSTRQSREELIKKGVLKEVYDKGEPLAVSVADSSVVFGGCFSLSFLPGREDGAPAALREEERMENGRSPVLGCSLPACAEGAELMEGAAAAAGGNILVFIFQLMANSFQWSISNKRSLQSSRIPSFVR